MIFAVILSIVMMNTGCWDYKGMDEINLVSGIAIDHSDDGQFVVTLEIINLNEISEGTDSSPTYVTGVGPSIIEATRASKQKMFNKLYFGNTQTMILSQEIAKKENEILDIISFYLRAGESRETMIIVISQEDSASQLLKSKGLDVSNISIEIASIVREDKQVSSPPKKVMLYQAFNMLQEQGKELVLPAFKQTPENDETVVEVNGIAAFKGGSIVGYLSVEDTKYFMLLSGDDAGGAISLEGEDSSTISCEIMGSKSKVDVKYQDGKAYINADVAIDMTLVQLRLEQNESEDSKSSANKGSDKDLIESIENIEEKIDEMIRENIISSFKTVQQDIGSDIYCFGNKLFKSNLELWQQVSENWNEIFKQAELEVTVRTNITNSGYILG